MLNNLRDKPGAYKFSKKTLGRGIGSGKGKTSGRGEKGQSARSGVSLNGFEGGQMPLYRRLPKRGFSNAVHKSRYRLLTVSALFDILRGYPATDSTNKDVDIRDIFAPSAVDKRRGFRCKLLLDDFNKEGVKSINLKIHSASKSAVSALEAVGCSVEIIK